MKLELRHLIPYLPYGVRGILTQDLRDDFQCEDWLEDIEIINKGAIWQYAGYADDDLFIPLGEGDFSGLLIRNGNTYTSVGNSIKPILRPLSDLIKIISIGNNEGWETDWVDYIFDIEGKLNEANILIFPYNLIEFLLEKHIDVFGLIKQGLAININNLK